MTNPLGSTALTIEARAKRNPYYAKIVNAQYGYSEAAALRDKAQAKRRSTLFPQVSWPEAPADSSADLDEYLTAFTAAWDEQQNRTRDAEALDTVIGACERTMQSVIGDPDCLLQALAGDFDELMDHLRETVSRLNGATTPTEAIDADTATVWRELPELRAPTTPSGTHSNWSCLTPQP